MSKKPQYASQAENELYEAIYWLTYKDSGRSIAPSPGTTDELYVSLKAITKAENAGVMSRDVTRITSRATFDALLDLAREGYRRYIECFLIIELNEKTGERSYRAGDGDVPESLPLEYEYIGTLLPKAGILLNCYFRVPESHRESIFIAIQHMDIDGGIKLT